MNTAELLNEHPVRKAFRGVQNGTRNKIRLYTAIYVIKFKKLLLLEGEKTPPSVSKIGEGKKKT